MRIILMGIAASRKEGDMFEVNVFNNGDHACVGWRPAGADPAAWRPLPECRGFAIERKLTRNGQTTQGWLHNRVGFREKEAPPAEGEGWRWPMQRYLWWDYDVRPGDTVSYRVAPMIGAAAQLTAPDGSGATEWTEPQLVGSDFGDNISAWFNRGVIATQWVTRALRDQATGRKPRPTLMAAISEKGNPLREQLGGLLKEAVLSLLKNAPGDVYAALYELNDFEVKDAFVALGKRCNLILGNGAFKPPETDENKEARDELRATEIILHDRIVSGNHFAHNKFIVFCDAAGQPESVFTGSTNLTLTGLCTQVNNGILIRDRAVAQDYLDAWNRLLAAGNDYPPALIQGNSIARTRQVGATSVSPWFAAVNAAQDLEQARGLIEDARDGILFLFFNPGHYAREPKKETLLQDVLERKATGDLYVRGVVNQEITGLTDTDIAPVNLVRTGQETDHLPKSVLVPAAIHEAYGNWEAELKGASSVMIHSKVVVLDPFGAKPVVMTGSNNLGFKASHSNDDNLNIIVGNAKLAQAYAANIVAIFQEYRWRDYVATHEASGGWKGLEDNDAWQAGHLARERDEMLFWVPA
jgi:phosphatidylserine/phosphatidylglycerophosphate/cardiolipin synthase-like enzyme